MIHKTKKSSLKIALEMYKKNTHPIEIISSLLNIQIEKIKIAFKQLKTTQTKKYQHKSQYVINKAIQLYQKSHEVSKICKDLQISPKTLYKHLKRKNIKPIWRKQKRKNIEKALDLYTQENKKILEICKECQISSSILYRNIKKRNLQNIRWKEIENNRLIVEEAIELYKQGYNLDDICTKLQIKRSSLDYYLTKKDIRNRNLKKEEKVILKAIEFYRTGYKIEDICQELKISKSTLFANLKKKGLLIRQTVYEKTCKERRSLAIELYQIGVTKTEICKKLEIKLHTLNQYLRDKNIESIWKKQKTENMEKAIEMYKNGTPVSVIYKECQISSTLLYKYLKLKNIRRRA